MINICIIAGGGYLPIIVGNKLKEQNYKITFLLLKDALDKKIYKEFENYKLEIISLKKILNFFRNKKINKIIMLGNMIRPSIKDLAFDLTTLKFIKDNFLEKKGDNSLLLTLKNFFEDNEINFFDWTSYCHDIFSNEIYLTKQKPSKPALENLKKSIKVFKYFGQSDVGQSMIVQNKIILGLEAIEGTDELIKRCHKYKKKGDIGQLIKFSKFKQSNLLDIPSVGINTVKLLKKYNYEGMFLEKNKCIIIDKDKVIDFSNKNKLFISCVKID